MPKRRHNASLPAPTGLLVGLLLMLVGVGLGLGPGSGQAKKPRKPTGPAGLEAIFDSTQPAIRDCALTHGIYKGAKSIELTATLMVARDGRVFSEQVQAKTDGGNAKDLEACVSKVLHAMTFPAANDTFRKLLRNWKFATQ